MNVLIVDDQRLSRAGLAKMIDWERLGLIAVGESANGKDALERIGDTDADIVITDVRMPAMGGLELVEKAREQYPDIAWIIVSGYDDFSYVRKSIQLTVADYLLKPVNPHELNELLSKLVQKKVEQRLKTETERRRLRERFFHLLLEGAYGNAEETEFELLSDFSDLQFTSPKGKFVAVAFDSRLDKSTLYQSLQPLETDYEFCLLRIRTVYTLILVSADLMTDRLALALQQITIENLPLLHNISIGSIAENIYQVPKSVGQALDAFAIRNSYKSDNTDEPFFYDTMENSMTANIPLTAAWEQEWAVHLRLGNRQQALDKLDELLVSNSMGIQSNIIDGCCQYVLLRGARELYESGLIREPDFAEACRLAGIIPAKLTTEDKRREVTDFFRSRLKETESFSMMKARHAVENARAYIDANYCQSINLSELAQNSYMSPGHFSSLFRQLTGKNFLEYLTYLRIEHAKTLLHTDPNRKIGEVAQQCGYQDMKYFRKLFKRHTGLTPASFKEELRSDQAD